MKVAKPISSGKAPNRNRAVNIGTSERVFAPSQREHQEHGQHEHTADARAGSAHQRERAAAQLRCAGRDLGRGKGKRHGRSAGPPHPARTSNTMTATASVIARKKPAKSSNRIAKIGCGLVARAAMAPAVSSGKS
jgi:hypothetical protein